MRDFTAAYGCLFDAKLWTVLAAGQRGLYIKKWDENRLSFSCAETGGVAEAMSAKSAVLLKGETEREFESFKL